MALSRIMARRMVRGLATAAFRANWPAEVLALGENITATFSKAGYPAEVVTLGKAGAGKKPGDNEVALKFLAAPVTATDLGTIQGKLPVPSLPAVPGSEGVAIVTEVGSKVSGLAPNDLVVPITPIGTWRSRGTVKASDVAKVPSTLPVEYAANINVAITAYTLVAGSGLQAGDLLVQNAADSLVGLAIVQVARKLGIRTLSVIQENNPVYFQVASLIKELGGEIVLESDYVGTPAYKKLVSDLPAPKVLINGLGDQGASALSAAFGKGAKVVSYGGAKGFSVADWFKKESENVRSTTLDTLARWFDDGSLLLWVERHPFCDLSYALNEAAEPFKVRSVTLVIDELPKPEEASLKPEDVAKLQTEFEAAFRKLRTAV